VTADRAPAPLPPPRLGSRDLFPELATKVYANHAGVSPLSLRVRRAVDDLLTVYACQGASAVSATLAVRSRLRAAVARLVGARPDEIALTSGASHGLLAIALSFPWKPGDRFVVFQGEFPANVAPWLRAAKLFGLEPLFLDARDLAGDGELGLVAIDRALRRGARLVALSAVQFQTGARMPLAAVAELCARHGAAVCVDAIQAVGVLPFDVKSLGIDFAAGGAHKWLMGIEGAGYLYVREDRIAELRPALAGWLSHEDPVSFLTEGREGLLRYDRPLRIRADVFEGSSAASASFAAFEASIETILSLGVPAIHEHVSTWCNLLEPALRERGFEVLRAADPARRSGILSARAPAGVDARRLRDALAKAGVAVGIPDGLVRFSPHWPNSLEEIDVIAEALDGA
jgi:selenocysteine lyase/cysteine desulfurase